VYAQAPTPRDDPNAYTPVAFFSEDTPYSIIKAMRVLAIQTFYELGEARYPGECPIPTADGRWPQEVPSTGGNDGPGTIDVDALAKLVEFFAARGYPILVSFNYGTTFKGAYDDVEAAGRALMPILERHGLLERTVYYDPAHPDRFDVRTGFWMHVDGALGAAFMPFIEMANAAGLTDRRGPNFDFRLPWVHSISMSGHKWIGAPWPCGIYMTRTKMQLRPPDDPEYIGSPDTTFAGSRNGFSSMVLWDYLATHSYEAQIAKALRTEELAGYAEERLKALQDELGLELWVARSPLSLTIRFRKAVDELGFKYSLSGETLQVATSEGDRIRKFNHVFMMEHVTRERIDSFIEDLRREGFDPTADEPVRRPVADHVLESRSAAAARPLMHVPHTGRGFVG
jgi:histidine decarboxylase